MSELKRRVMTTAVLAVEIEINCDGTELDEESTKSEISDAVRSSSEIFDVVSAFILATNELRKLHPEIKAVWTPIMDVEPLKEI